MKKCNLFFIVSFAVLFGWFSHLYVKTYENKRAYNFLAKINSLEKENTELKTKLDECKLKNNR